MAAKPEESKTVVQRQDVDPLAELERAKPLPELLAPKIDLRSWVKALILNEDYKSPMPDAISRKLMLRTMTATTVSDILGESETTKLREWIPNTVGASSGNLTLADMDVMPTRMAEGLKTYLVLTVIVEATGEEITFSTSAQRVQAALIALLANGFWPLRFRIVRSATATRSGQLMFALYAIED